MKLTSSVEAQRTLEELIDPSKPQVPAPCSHLHYLLFTPFRYRSHNGSRFRRAGQTDPVFYAAEHEQTAVAEFTFHRLRFFAESPDTPWPTNPLVATTFSVQFATDTGLDLAKPPFDADATLWTDPMDYSATQQVADDARALGCDVIRSMSVRDPSKRANITLLSCATFSRTSPDERRTWRLQMNASGQFARCEHPYDAITYDRVAFANDPRIQSLNWNR